MLAAAANTNNNINWLRLSSVGVAFSDKRKSSHADTLSCLLDLSDVIFTKMNVA